MAGRLAIAAVTSRVTLRTDRFCAGSQPAARNALSIPAAGPSEPPARRVLERVEHGRDRRPTSRADLERVEAEAQSAVPAESTAALRHDHVPLRAKVGRQDDAGIAHHGTHGLHQHGGADGVPAARDAVYG